MDLFDRVIIFVKETASLFVGMEHQNILIQFGVEMPIETVRKQGSQHP